MTDEEMCKRFKAGQKIITFNRGSANLEDLDVRLQAQLGNFYNIGWQYGTFGIVLLYNYNYRAVMLENLLDDIRKANRELSKFGETTIEYVNERQLGMIKAMFNHPSYTITDLGHNIIGVSW